MRYCKTDGDYITNYYYDSQNNLIGLDKAGSTLFFYYDSNGTPTSFKNNGIMYYYIRNLQGDIVKIVKQDGTVAASYTYDAWGKILTIKDGSNVDVPSSNAFHVANLNPYRYRGYIYDNETGFYYLQTRYYDPITGIFLNADDTYYLKYNNNVLSTNLFTYCKNNTINEVDYNGTSSFELGMVPPGIRPTDIDEIVKLLSSLYCISMCGLIGTEQVKYIVSVVASAYLNERQFYVTKNMFLQSIWGEGVAFGPDVSQKIVKLLLSNSKFMDAVKSNAFDKKIHTVYLIINLILEIYFIQYSIAMYLFN